MDPRLGVSRFWRAYAILATLVAGGYLLVTQGPVRLTFGGYCSYEVPDERAARTLVKVTTLAGLGEKYTFDTADSHQCVLSDGVTVLQWLDPQAREAGGNGNSRSLMVSDPAAVAEHARLILKDAGYTAEVSENKPANKDGEATVTLKTDALSSGCLIFKKTGLLGPEEKKRVPEPQK